MIKVVAVAVPWNNFGHLPVLEATCRLCLEGFKIIQGCVNYRRRETIIDFRHNIECHALRRTHMIKFVAVAIP